MSFEVRFLFTSPRGALTEIRRLDLPSAAECHHVYHWLWISERAVTSLRFIAMQSGARQMRTFREADLSFNENDAELRWRNGDTIALETVAARTLDENQHRLVRNHLS